MTNPNHVSSFIPIVRMELDDQAYQFAMDGSTLPFDLSLVSLSVADHFYSKRVRSISIANREIPRLCGLFSIGSITITYNNGDQYMSQLKAAQPWRGRTVSIQFGDPELGLAASFSPAYTGIISDWNFQNDECTQTISDDSLVRFDVPITKYLRRLVPGGYPGRVPSYSQAYLIPWIGGAIQAPADGDNAGQLPAYCIDPDTFTYVAANGFDVTVDSVYVYGALVPTSRYTASGFFSSGGEGYTTIVFASDPRDFLNHSNLEVEVTWCGGTAEHRPIYLFETFLTTRAGFTSAELDTTTWNLVKTEFDDRGYVGSLVVTDASFTIGDVVSRFLKSYGLQLFKKRNGLWALNFIGLSKTAALALTEKDVIPGSFRQSSYPSDTFASRIHLNYDYNYANPGNEYFGHTPDLVSPAEETNLNNDTPYNFSQWFGRSLDGDASTPQSIAGLMLSLMRESGNQVEVEIPVRHFSVIDLGDVFTLDHWEGIGDSGFVGQRIVVLGIRMIPLPRSSQLVLSGYVEPVETFDLAADFQFNGGLTVDTLVAA